MFFGVHMQVTNRRQVAHHKEGSQGGVKEEGNPFSWCCWNAQAADTGCVACKNIQ